MSKRHPDWAVDELLLFAVFASIAAAWIMAIRSRHLRREVRRRSDAAAQAERLARRDPLTGLANRRQFVEEIRERAAEAERGAKRFVAILIDLDGFKPVNDGYGHATGDLLLQQVAERLLKNARDDDLVARLGGDEFAVIGWCDASEPHASTAQAQRLCAALSEPFLVDGLRLRISASIGVARQVEDEPETLLLNADRAMYLAKREGGGRVAHFDEDLDAKLRWRGECEREIQAGLERGEFVPHFQPLIALDSGEICGFEILARWRHPVRGLQEAESFLPIADKAQLSAEISWAVLRRACAEALRWPTPFAVSLKLSPDQLRDPDLAETCCAILRQTGLPPARLEVAMAESGLLTDAERAERIVTALKRRGVRVCLDDFGAACAALRKLQKLPFDAVKIDRSFVAGADGEERGAKMLQGLMLLAQSLGPQASAEDMETEDVEIEGEEAWVKRSGRVQAQGFLYAKPMSAEETRWFLETRRPEAPEGATGHGEKKPEQSPLSA